MYDDHKQRSANMSALNGKSTFAPAISSPITIEIAKKMRLVNQHDQLSNNETNNIDMSTQRVLSNEVQQ